MAVIDGGSSTAGKANVDATYNLRVNTPGRDAGGVERGGGNAAAGGSVMLAEIDGGTATGARLVRPMKVDGEGRLRIAQVTMLDREVFNYTAQNTGRHTSVITTLAFSWSAAGLTSNSGSITTTATGATFGSYATFSLDAPGSLRCQVEMSFSAQPVSNTIVDFGLFLRGAGAAYAPTDGAYFRLNASGLIGVLNSNGVETTTPTLPFTYTNSQVYQFDIVVHDHETEFWADSVLLGSIATPTGNGYPYLAVAVPFSIRHAIVGGAAGGVLQSVCKGYSVTAIGYQVSDTLGTIGNRINGSYQALSGGTMGSLANYANSANPTAAVPTNTTAALGTGLGGQFWETATLAVNTDGIICSYQIPAASVTQAGRRLRINGVKISSFVQTALTAGGYNEVWGLAFGHTAVSLATAEAVNAKAPRRVMIGSRTVAAATAALTSLGDLTLSLENPVYVMPGEFVAVITKHVGTAASAGVVAHQITLDYSWE